MSAGLLEDLRTYPDRGSPDQQLDLLRTRATTRLGEQNAWVSRSLFRIHYQLLKVPNVLLRHLTQPSGKMLVRYREEGLRVGRGLYLKDCRRHPAHGPTVQLPRKPEESAEDFCRRNTLAQINWRTLWAKQQINPLVLQLRNDCLRLLEEDLVCSPEGFQTTPDQLEDHRDQLEQRLEEEFVRPWEKALLHQRHKILTVFQAQETAFQTGQSGQTPPAETSSPEPGPWQEELLQDYQQALNQRLTLWRRMVAHRDMPRKLLTPPTGPSEASEASETKAF